MEHGVPGTSVLISSLTSTTVCIQRSFVFAASSDHMMRSMQLVCFFSIRPGAFENTHDSYWAFLVASATVLLWDIALTFDLEVRCRRYSLKFLFLLPCVDFSDISGMEGQENSGYNSVLYGARANYLAEIIVLLNTRIAIFHPCCLPMISIVRVRTSCQLLWLIKF